MNTNRCLKKGGGLDFKFCASEQKGITLLFVMVILAALLSIGAGIFNIALGQLKISGEIADSFIAFYAADQGIEQILFRDRNIGGLCGGVGAGCYIENNVTVASGGCYTIRVNKTAGNETEIVALGQYRCGATPSRVVKRGFLLTYANTGGTGPSNNYGTGLDLFDSAKMAPGLNNLTTKSVAAGRTEGDMINFSVINNVAPNAIIIRVSEPLTGLAAGDEVLIINLQRIGNAPIGPVGDWETQIVDSINVAAKTVTLESGVSNRYDGNNYKIMLQRVPNYDRFRISSGEQVGVNAWNGTKGGVFFVRVADTFTLEAGSEAAVVGNGYKGGGQSLQGESRTGTGNSANTNNDGGGGGFNATLDGGAGGAGYAANGGRGGSDPIVGWGWGGDGGTAYGDASLAQLFFGSGGGGGTGCASSRGGNGGGIMYIAANIIVNNGAIRANASNAIGGCPTGTMDDPWSGAGGGSGGSLVIQSTANPAGTIEVLGTNGLTGGVKNYCVGFGGGFCANNRNKGGDGSSGRTVVP